jgi:hypothetical protein
VVICGGSLLFVFALDLHTKACYAETVPNM